MIRKALLIFLRHPAPGEVKSRLARDVGQERAAEIYERLIRRTLGVAADFKRHHPDVDVRIHYTPTSMRDALERTFPGPWSFVPQDEGHLGQRMKSAIDTTLADGAAKVILVGTDIADLAPHDFVEAFSHLHDGMAVLGPASDGGFYLIGLTQSRPIPFDSPEWGTSSVFERTKKRLEESGLNVRVMKQRHDIDLAPDLPNMENDPLFQVTLSVVIPTLSTSGDLHASASSLASQLWPGDEILYVFPDEPGSDDGGCVEGMPRVRHLRAPRGRGLQMNAGAAQARGDLLLFLHDDSTPPAHFAYLVRKLALAPQCSLGCFRLRFHPSSPALDFIAGWANLRTRIFQLPYGDQGLFCRRSTFSALGGYKKPYLMEDIDLVRRSRRLGRLFVVPEEMTTSPRRYACQGTLRASLQNHLLYLLDRMGVGNRTLHDVYYHRRR